MLDLEFINTVGLTYWIVLSVSREMVKGTMTIRQNTEFVSQK